MLNKELAGLAAHLMQRRNEILAAWRQRVRQDPVLTTGDSLPRAQLNDHIPALLQTFEQKLDPALHADKQAAPSSANEQSAAHGLHRWQQGYDLREVSRELGRLNECMVTELHHYAVLHPGVAHETMATAGLAWAELCSIAVSESTAQYFRLRQTEAAGQVRDLELALEQLRNMETKRAELWHQAAHDMRGNLGIVVNVATGLSRPAPDATRSRFFGLLERNVKSLHLLVEDVMNLARLQAGKEKRQIALIDGAVLLAELCEGLQGEAQERNLSLEYTGPPSLVIEGDAVKLRRIAQNLVLNALKYTRHGGIKVGLQLDVAGDANRWMLSVQDTGPGFDAGPGTPLAGALEAATELAHETDADAKSGQVSWAGPATGMSEQQSQVERHGGQEQGEGIGLSIVKRLAELLDAGVEIETGAAGTTVRVLFPKHYAA